MKFTLAFFATIFLIGCNQSNQHIVQKGEVFYIYYRDSLNTSELLTGEDYKDGDGPRGANSILRYRYPYITIYENYLLISYPGTDMRDKIIPREALISLEWKKQQSAEKPQASN